MLSLIINILIGACFVLTFLACYIEPIQAKVKSVTTSILLERMKISKSPYFNYDRLDMFINEYGVSYMLSESINPVSYIIIKLVVGVLAGALVFSGTSNVVMFFLFFALGFLGVDLLVKLNNKRDNEEMLLDISNIYDVLKLQLEAGVFITDSINSCYKNCKNKRLKDGLLMLYIDIRANSNIVESLRKFNARFNNTNISTLCAVLEQSLVTGQVVDVLENVSKENVSIQKLYNVQYKRKIEGQYHKLGIGIVLGVLAVLLMIMGMEFVSILMQF